VKHLNTQQAEADELRKQLSVATAAATQADENISERLEACLAEEREQAVIDRQTLLSQISQLVNASGSIQDERMSSKIKAVRAEMATSRAEFRAASTTYNSSMDIWSKKESLVVEEVLKSRETLKGKLKQDWAAVNEHNTSIQTTTKSVHEETVRIVDAQVTEMASQMQALDDFVTRARSQNESHNKLHIESFNGLASSVYQSYSDSRAHLGSISGRIQAHQGAISAANASLAATLPSLDLSVTEPLSDLREAVLDAPLREYAPTGETPQKTQYSYPTSLPRTDAHETLLGKPARSRIGTTLAGLAEASASPTKSVVYTDTPGEDASLVRPSSMDGGIREIDVNIAGVLARPDAATAPTKSEAENLASSLMGLSASLMGPPPLKRQATETRLPQKHGGGRAGVVRIEGRENVAPGPRGRRMLRSSTVE
jgi:kinesin family protein 11